MWWQVDNLLGVLAFIKGLFLFISPAWRGILPATSNFGSFPVPGNVGTGERLGLNLLETAPSYVESC